MTKSLNGPSTLSSKAGMNFKASDLVSIIKACNDANVSEITMGDTRIVFSGAKCPEYLTDVANIPETDSRSVPSESQDELEQLLLSNPSAFEELVEVTE